MPSTTIQSTLKPKQYSESWPSRLLRMCIGSHLKFTNACALYAAFFSGPL